MSKKTKSQKLQNRQEDPQKWTKKKIGIIIYTIIMVIYGFYTMILSIAAYAEFSGVVFEYNQIVNNLSEKTIVDIKKSTSACDGDYESIFSYDFMGTYDGCDCTVGTPSDLTKYDLSSKVYQGVCDNNQTLASCGDIDSIDAKEMELYNINNVAQNICVKRSGYTFYKDAPTEAKCGSDEKTCGNADENPNSVFCVKQSEDCPIYSFVFSSPSDTTYTSDNYQELTLDFSGSQTYSFYYSRSGNEQPMSELRVTEGRAVCQNNTRANIDKGHSEYILMTDQRTYCDEVDKRFEAYTEALENTEYQFFEANDLEIELDSLPDFSLSTTNYHYNAYFRKFLQWDVEERDLLRKVVTRQDSVDKMSGSQLTVMVINIIACIVVSIILTISQVYNLCGKDVPCIDGDGEAEQQRIKKIKKICSYGAKALQLPFVIWALVLSGSNRKFFKDVASSEASDSVTNENMSDLASLIEDEVYWKNIQMIIALIIVILLDIALYAKKKCCTSKNNTQVDKIQPHQELEQDSPEKKRGQQHFPTPQDQNQTQNFSSNNMMMPQNQAQQPPKSGFMQNINQPPQDNIMQPPQNDIQQPPQ